MTKEEIIEAFKFIVKKCDKIINTDKYVNIDEHLIDTVEDIAELCNRIIDGQFGDILEGSKHPSLPSNLDEAAEKYADRHGFRVPYDGSNDFYDKVDVKASLEGFKAGAEWMAGQGWHDITETPSIFGFYLVIHEKGWCAANYMGEGVICESGWVEAINHIEIKHPQKWLDLRDLIPKKQ